MTQRRVSSGSWIILSTPAVSFIVPPGTLCRNNTSSTRHNAASTKKQAMPGDILCPRTTLQPLLETIVSRVSLPLHTSNPQHEWAPGVPLTNTSYHSQQTPNPEIHSRYLQHPPINTLRSKHTTSQQSHITRTGIWSCCSCGTTSSAGRSCTRCGHGSCGACSSINGFRSIRNLFRKMIE